MSELTDDDRAWMDSVVAEQCPTPHVWVKQPDGAEMMRCETCRTIIVVPAYMLNMAVRVTE